MKISIFLNELKNRNTLLYYFGWFNIALLVFTVIMFFVDNTIIMGINAWIKPAKFAISITIYVWTFAWILFYLPAERKIRTISWIIIVCMLAEILLIFMQAYRGVTSHFNVTTTFNAWVFRIMGIFISLNSFIILYVLIQFFIKPIDLPDYQKRAWQAGLLMFLLGGISGGIMAAKFSHTIGYVDGGPGLPFVNWSTIAGDLRSAHFITLHGLQAIPIFGWLGASKLKSPKKAVELFFIFYLLVCIALHLIAFMGIPLIHT